MVSVLHSFEMEKRYQDCALILAWPDTTIRGDEKWMMFFKKLGLVKNLNFKVGHTAIVLVEKKTGKLSFYDFGRYISPRGHGRARSEFSDPRLRMDSQAVFDASGNILNLKEICEELQKMQDAIHAQGRMIFSVAQDINYEEAQFFGDKIVNEGSTPYGAVARGNNNCSRFITRLLKYSSKKYHNFHPIHFPETIKASPLSNIVNVRKDRKVFFHEEDGSLKEKKMSRWGSFWFLFKQLSENCNQTKSQSFPDDEIIGYMDGISKPTHLPSGAQWLGGIGMGAWFLIEQTEKPHILQISRFTENGILEYKKRFESPTKMVYSNVFDIKIIHDNHLLIANVQINNKKYSLYPTSGQIITKLIKPKIKEQSVANELFNWEIQSLN